MSEKTEERFRVTAQDLKQYNWQDRITKEAGGNWLSSRYTFAAAAKECKDAGDDLGVRVYSLLNAIVSFWPNYDAHGNPYGPAWQGADGKRSLMAEDLSDSDLDALAGLLPDVKDPDFRARVADIIWECKRDYKTAEMAVRSFVEASNQVKTDDMWPPYTERLERAAQLAAKLGFGKKLHQEVLGVVEKAISDFENNPKAGLLCRHLMDIALAHGASDTARYVQLSQRLAKDFAAAGNWDFSKTYWESAEQWFKRAKSEDEVHRCQIAAAECLVSKAEQGLTNDKLGAPFAAHWMGAAVEALRQAKADPDRIKEVHRRFLKLQQQGLSATNTMELDVDAIPGFRDAEEKTINAAVAHVSGYDLETAVARLAHVGNPTNTVELRKQMEAQSKEFVWDKIVETTAVDHAGKVTDTIEPIGFGPTEAENAAMRKKMVMQTKQTHWPLQVAWKIEPARVTIIKEHGVRRRDLVFLVANNPFIPSGHEGIYLRGLQSGFFGDWLVAMHLLVAQIEASVRYVLQQHNVVTSTLESDGIQKERDLNQLLWMSEFEKIFGPDVAFDLRGILIERFGDNMRNESAHGLMPEGAFYQPTAVYLWWLILRLCWMGYSQLPDDSDISSAPVVG
jgi:hypothetical protein